MECDGPAELFVRRTHLHSHLQNLRAPRQQKGSSLRGVDLGGDVQLLSLADGMDLGDEPYGPAGYPAVVDVAAAGLEPYAPQVDPVRFALGSERADESGRARSNAGVVFVASLSRTGTR